MWRAVVDHLLDLAVSPEPGQVTIEGRPTWVSDLAAQLATIAADYRYGSLPDLSDPFTKRPVQHLPIGDLSRAVPDPPDSLRRPARPNSSRR